MQCFQQCAKNDISFWNRLQCLQTVHKERKERGAYKCIDISFCRRNFHFKLIQSKLLNFMCGDAMHGGYWIVDTKEQTATTKKKKKKNTKKNKRFPVDK